MGMFCDGIAGLDSDSPESDWVTDARPLPPFSTEAPRSAGKSSDCRLNSACGPYTEPSTGRIKFARNITSTNCSHTLGKNKITQVRNDRPFSEVNKKSNDSFQAIP